MTVHKAESRVEPRSSRRRAEPVATAARFDPGRARMDFPILLRTVRGKPLVYLDNAATTQKPRQVLEAMDRYYEEENANVHRGIHQLSERATDAYEGARAKVARTLSADPREIVFVRGTTEAVNLVAQTFGRIRVGAGDEVLVTEMEHHSNIVPWQMLCREKGATLRVVPVTDEGELDLEALERLLGPRTRLLAVTHVSNALGTVNPIDEIVGRAHSKGVPVLVDGAQGMGHVGFDVRASGADFYAFSGHKIYGPTGIGVLFGRREHLEEMPPWQGGGDMILSVTFEKTVYNRVPYKLEAGTPDIAGAVGLGAALDYVSGLGLETIAAHERELLAYAAGALGSIPGVRLVGSPFERAGALSFLLGEVHPHDVGSILDHHGVAVRAGHHCAQPLMRRFGIEATVRASVALYNTREDVDVLVRAVEDVRRVFG